MSQLANIPLGHIFLSPLITSLSFPLKVGQNWPDPKNIRRVPQQTRGNVFQVTWMQGLQAADEGAYATELGPAEAK